MLIFKTIYLLKYIIPKRDRRSREQWESCSSYKVRRWILLILHYMEGSRLAENIDEYLKKKQWFFKKELIFEKRMILIDEVCKS